MSLVLVLVPVLMIGALALAALLIPSVAVAQESTTNSSAMRDLLPAAPPVGVTGMTLMGMPLSEWVLILTLVYTAVQIIIVLPKAAAVVRRLLRK